MDGPGIESQWGRGFPQPPEPPWCLPSLLYNGKRVAFPAGAWRYPPTPSRAEAEEIIELLYFYFPSVLSWRVIG